MKPFPLYRQAFLGTLVFTICGGFCPSASLQSAREVAVYASSSVVLVLGETTKGKAKRVSLGSGFFVADDVIATNNHVVAGADRLYAKVSSENRVYRLNPIATDAKRDLALLRVIGVKGKPLMLADDQRVSVGDTVYVIGNPEGLEGTFSQGIVSGKERQIGGGSYLQITAPISPGSSGGPVLQSSGEVIGIAVGALKVGQNLNFAIPVSALIKLMRFGVEEARGSTTANRSDVKTGGHTNGGGSLDSDPIVAKDIKKAQEYVRSSSGSAEAYYRLAETYRRWSFYDVEAIQAYKKAISLNPNYAEAFLGLGDVYQHSLHEGLTHENRENLLMAAAAAYKQAIRIRPTYVEAHIALGDAYDSLSREEEAIEEFKIARKLDPNARDAYRGLGGAYEWLGRFPEAIDALKEAVRIDPQDISSYTKLARILGQLERFDDAIRYGKLAIKLTTGLGPEWPELRRLYQKSSRIQAGIADFNQLITQIKAELIALQSRGVKGAEPAYLNMKLIYAYQWLGFLYVDLGDKASALEQYKVLKGFKNSQFTESCANDLFNEIYK